MVPATLHVTVWLPPTFHVTLVLGALTTKGPVDPLTVTVIKSSAVCPPPALLSRTVKAKSSVLPTEGTTSQVGVRLPATTSLMRGIYLSGEDVPLNVRNIGPCVRVEEGAELEFGFSGSFSSQV